MSFIVKRERVFNDYDLLDLPPRNEGKLKAYASCTDARAWSHFCATKSEHLTEVIKRNNDTAYLTKYVPTKIIVDTIMATKNIEISRLRRRIREFEQLLAAWNDLELNCHQKREIEKAHATIRAASKNLSEMCCLNLDTSNFTEGCMDSEAYETGESMSDESVKSRGDESDRSRGDEWNFEDKKPTVFDQMETITCDACVTVTDPRIGDMQDQIIAKDAKLNAMRNTLAVMENDVCEPYGVYAHIYTALEKIYGILSQNTKYRQYLNLMTAGKDTRSIDIKGKILFKLKILEKFCLALIAPCSREFMATDGVNTKECKCYRAEVITRVDTTFPPKLNLENSGSDVKRSQLIADIMENVEMKDILDVEGTSGKAELERFELDEAIIDTRYCINEENRKRLKDLQSSYEDLLNCYENLKHEKDCLQVRCLKYDTLEAELETLRAQLREYNSLWNEKEHYKNRSEDLDSLKEQYLVLVEESSGLETKLKAESEINSIKSSAVEDLRQQNISLEKKITDIYVKFEKEKNALQCKLQETECKCMCQEQQIKSLSTQIVQFFEQQEPGNVLAAENTTLLINEKESLKDKLRNLQDLEEEFQDKISIITELKGDVDVWRNSYEKISERNKYLEDCVESRNEERMKLVEENIALQKTVQEKTGAVENLMEMINNKSKEINKLMDQNHNLINQLDKLKAKYEDHVANLDNEKKQALSSLQLSKQESKELLQKVKDYDYFVQKQEDLSQTIENKMLEFESTKRELQQKIEENEKLKRDLAAIQIEDEKSKKSVELAKKDSLILEQRLSKLDNISQQFTSLKDAYKKLSREKMELENELQQKVSQLDSAVYSVKIDKKESGELKKQHEIIQKQLGQLDSANQSLLTHNNFLNTKLNELRDENAQLKRKFDELSVLQQELSDLRNNFNDLLQEKQKLKDDIDSKNQKINDLYNTLENKMEENKYLQDNVKTLEIHNLEVVNSIQALENDKLEKIAALDTYRKESSNLIQQLKLQESLESEYNKLKNAHDEMKSEKERLQKSLEEQLEGLKKLEHENQELYGQTNNLLTLNSDLEDALMTTRNELISVKSNPEKPIYTDLELEVRNMRDEKLKSQKKIRKLLDSLDEAEHFNFQLNEKLCARDDKIAIMQNQINELEAEMRSLQDTLAQAIDSGNAIKSTSYQNIDQSIKKLEAHHSKATHNIKMELAIMQNANTKLEDQLSVTRLQSLETLNDRKECIDRITKLRNEREVIVTDIKELEIHSLGNSVIMPENCEVEQVLASLDRIRGCFNARHSKNTTLEQTLLKVQTSSQLVLSKADDAKKYFEKEQQKIFSEKDEAIKEKKNLEKQLLLTATQKKQLEGEIAHYQRLIKDLERESLNQKLITDKLNDKTKNYISKLTEEAQSLQDLYQNAAAKVNELQEKNKACEAAKEEAELLKNKLVKDFTNKSKEVAELKEKLSSLLNKPKVNKELQISLPNNKNDMHETYTQTSNLPDPEIHDERKSELKLKSEESAEKLKEVVMIASSMQSSQKDTHNPAELLTNQKPPYTINEVQILSANVEPSFDFVKNSYQNYKIKRLSPGLLEHHSFPDQSTSRKSTLEELSPTDGDKTGITNNQNANQASSNLINIYSRPSNDMDNSSKLLNNSAHKQDSRSLLQTNDSYRTESNINNQHYGESSPYPPSKSTDKDVLVIYRDSESIFEEKPYYQEEIWSDERDHKIGSEKPTSPSMIPDKSDDFDQYPIQTVYSEATNKKSHDKQKIKIALPKLGNEGTSLGTMSDADKKSLDCYSVSNYDLPKRSNYSDTNLIIDASIKSAALSLPSVSNEGIIYGGSQDFPAEPSEKEMRARKQINQEDHRKLEIHDSTPDLDKKRKENAGKESHHKLARVGGDAFLIKSTDDEDDNAKKCAKANQNNYALEYILDTVKREGHHMPGYGASDELLQNNRDNRPSCSKISGFKDSPEFSTSRTISVERSVMTMPDETTEYYTKIIQNLTTTLENVEKEYKQKLDAIKAQYDRNINNIINEHNQGVKTIQSLHEETLHDIMKVHENEVDNLRSMSMEAMRKSEKLERENMSLKAKCRDSLGSTPVPDETPVRPCSPECKRRKIRMRCDTKILTKTNVEAFNVKPKRLLGPCTCSLDVNISDTIRNIFEQVGAEQRKLAETAYLKYIAGKISSGNIEGLDAQELSFLHLKVCRTWKLKLSKEEALQKKIDSLEVELMNRQRSAQQHMAELDRKVAEEKQRLEEVREAVCRNNPIKSPGQSELLRKNTASCCCNTDSAEALTERRSAGDLLLPGSLQQKKTRTDINRAVLAKLDVEERRERKLYSDEPPTRLRRHHERPVARSVRK